MSFKKYLNGNKMQKFYDLLSQLINTVYINILFNINYEYQDYRENNCYILRSQVNDNIYQDS